MTAEDETPSGSAGSKLDTAGMPGSFKDREPTRFRVSTSIANVLATCRSRWRPIVTVASTIVALASVAGLFFFQCRPDRQMDDAAVDEAVRAASEGAVSLLSYSSDSLDRDFADANSHLTGDFLAYYNKFTREVVAPVVRDKHLVQKAVVVRAAASQFHPASAEVLAFVNETVTSADKKDPSMTPAAVRITVQKVDGTWLISKLDPIG